MASAAQPRSGGRRSSIRRVDRQSEDFIAYFDALADRLIPARRPQDSGEPECSRTELRALAALARREPVSMTELASALDVPLSTATRTVDKLVAKDLVERRSLQQDRRVVQVGFSRRGKEINRYVMRSRVAAARRMLQALSLTGRKTLLLQLERLSGHPRPRSQ